MVGTARRGARRVRTLSRWVWLAFLGVATGAASPDLLQDALGSFTPDVPPGWAYTIATTRNERHVVERFDPASPAGAQWTLIEYEHREPSAKERDKYASSRPSADSGGQKSTFKKADLEPGSFRLVQEDAERAEYAGGFRTVAAESDKMLAHLGLRLTVNKRLRYVEKYVMSLPEPYSPVLGVRMDSLVVTAEFSPPTEATPSMLQAHNSAFSGRILFIRTTEVISTKFSDFRKVQP